MKKAQSAKKKKAAITVESTLVSLQDKKAKQIKDLKSETDEEQNTSKTEEKLANFTKFYKENNLVPENEWYAFFTYSTRPPPVTFRIVESYRLCPSHVDTVPGVPSQARVLMRYMQQKYVDTINKITIGNKQPVHLGPLPWYPKELAWMLNITQEETEKYLGLKDFENFLKTERMQNTLQRVETWSLFPPLILDVKPQHLVLDMCASPGFLASQVCEMMNAEPLQANAGMLVLNDLYKTKDKILYQWTQGIKVVYTFYDARKYPEFYLSDKKTLQNAVRYDRIMCDVKCSVDGTMRKNTGIQVLWNVRASLQYHSEQKEILKRALELVKVKGRVLYSTTTMNPIENEAIIMAMIKEAKGSVELFDVRPMIKDFKYRPGMTTWKVMTEDGIFLEKYSDANEEFTSEYPETVFPPPIKEAMAYHMERCIRVLPHDSDTAGWFCAVLVKNSELPWIREKILEEMKVQQQQEQQTMETEEESSGLKKYGYTIKLKCHVIPTEIEWVTETTNQKLQTTTRTNIERYAMPEQEMDPACKPRELIPSVDGDFTFCEQTTEQWILIKAFFGITDDFDPTNMVMRNNRTTFYQSCPMVKALIQNNRDQANKNFGSDFGVCMFFVLPTMIIHMNTSTPVMMSHECLSFLYPFIKKQLVNITSDDLIKLAFYDKVKIDTLSEKAQADLKETEQGCVLFVYRPKYMSSLPNCNITFVGARGEQWCLHFKDGKTSEWKNTFRLAGMEREDYGRKLQEEKLVAALAKDKLKEKEKEEEKMQT